MAWSEVQAPIAFRWLGLVVAGLAVGLFYWLFWALDRNWSTSLTIKDDHRVVTHGPYRWVRHPLYVAFPLMGIGFAMASANWFVLITALGGCLLTARVRTPMEEKMMLVEFGQEYQDYMDRTPRYFPRFRSFSHEPPQIDAR